MLAYHLLDVFTDRAFTGNQLAVFVDPPPLPAATRQLIATEMNLPETVFVNGGDDGRFRTHIHTTTVELPFAGHPTVGTAVCLARLGRVPLDDDGRGVVVLVEGVGDVVVEVVVPAHGAASARLTTPQAPVSLPGPDGGAAAAALGLPADALHPVWAPAAWSAGVPFTIVPVVDLAALGAVEVDPVAWRRGPGAGPAPALYAVTPLDAGGTAWRARMFAPALGMGEDPATGSAAAAFCGYLAAHGVAEASIDQGVEMGRPSRIEIAAGAGGRAVVGGAAVPVGEGRLHLVPAAPAAG